MKPAGDVHAIAQEVKAAQDGAYQIPLITSAWDNFDQAAAYQVADLIHQARIEAGAVPVGRKIGFTNPDMWSLYGVREPIWGYVYDTTVSRLSSKQAVCHIGSYCEPKIEPEIVVHFQSAPPITDNLNEIVACVDWIAHGIEIVQSHFSNWEFQAADTIADAALHGMLLVGKPQDVAQLQPDLITMLEQAEVTLSCNGDIRASGRGRNALGSPLAAIAHLLAVIAKQPETHFIRAHELVTTGTLTPALPIRPGETWATAFDGIDLQGISVQILA